MTAAEHNFLAFNAKEQFARGIAISLGLHLLLILVIIFGNIFLTKKDEFCLPSVCNVQLISPPTGEVLLSTPTSCSSPILKAEQSAVLTKNSTITNLSNKSEFKKTEFSKGSEQNFINEFARRLQKIKTKVDEQRYYEQILSQLEKRVANQTSNTHSLSSLARLEEGNKRSSSLSDQVYLAELWERIQHEWILPEVLVQKPKGLVAVVMLRIRRDGVLEKAWLEQSSGNQHYDELALRAAEKASPFSAPRIVAGIYYEIGIRFRADDIAG